MKLQAVRSAMEVKKIKQFLPQLMIPHSARAGLLSIVRTGGAW